MELPYTIGKKPVCLQKWEARKGNNFKLNSLICIFVGYFGKNESDRLSANNNKAQCNVILFSIVNQKYPIDLILDL